jgi:hypothetical protein
MGAVTAWKAYRGKLAIVPETAAPSKGCRGLPSPRDVS